MPSFFLWTPADFGTAGFITGGTFTMTGAPDVVDVTDDDLIFHDIDQPNSGSIVDPNDPQTLTNNAVLDGTLAGTAGENIYNAAEATITNNTTGETGRFLYITIGDEATAATFEGYASTIEINTGDSFTISGFTPTADEPYTNLVVCFSSGTLLRTDSGIKAIECLEVGDVLYTFDNGLKPIRWIGHRHLNEITLCANPNLRPIRIKAGALAKNVPLHDLIVSPQHRILIRSKIAIRMFDTNEIFVPAKHLLALPGVEIAKDIASVTYFHVMCDEHEIIEAEGALAETLYTGTEALKAMAPAAEREINDIFGEVPYLDRPLARLTPKARLAKKLVERHVKNGKELVQIA
ncbi:Hint domain-containing protein [Yoonia sp. SDW83-1]|uniref:Hint domain-containing protein n=1 Tax=Yoonia sp. SDW83-1 TaxID=3366945 RepID=UPI00398C5F56